jgi:hypothetical protein
MQGRSLRGLELFGGPLEEVEGLGGFLCYGVGGFFEFVGDFEDAGGVGGKSGDVSGHVGPVDRACAGP